MHTVLKKPDKALVSLDSPASALLLQGTRLYAATPDGKLASYTVSEDQSTAELQQSVVVPSSSSKAVAVQQLGFVKELQSLVALSGDGNLLLLDASTLQLQTSLSQHTKNQASLFALHSYVKPAAADESAPAAIVTTLATAARRRLILFRWQDGDWQEPAEVTLPHQTRSLTYMTPSTLVLGLSDGSYAKVNIRNLTNPSLTSLPIADMIPKRSTSQGALGQSSASSLSAGGAFSGGLGGLASRTGGYMGLGGKLAKNQVLSASKGELFVFKEGQGLLLPADGPAKEVHFDAEPESIQLIPPFAVLANPAPSPSLQVCASATLEVLQTIACSQPVRLLTSAAPLKMPLLLAINNDVFLYPMVSYPNQLEELLSQGQYASALALINGVEDPILADRAVQMRKAQSLVALQGLQRGQSENAMDTFIELDVNPAKVVGLFDERISGKLWLGDSAEEVFGGRSKDAVITAREAERQRQQDAADEDSDVPDTASIRSAASALWSPRKPSGRTSSPVGKAHSRQASTSSNKHTTTGRGLLQDTTRKEADHLKQSVEVLLRYLADRRQKINKALAALSPQDRPSTADPLPLASAQELLDLPDGPMIHLSPRQLHRVAQVIDTALFKCYLLVRPSLLGSLCRLDNWCEAEEVEGLLIEAKRYKELLDLYSGKGLHSKAVDLLKRMSEEDPEASPKEKVQPAVLYLQKLGPRHFDLICDVSKWVFSLDEESGMELFTADLEEVESLPRHAAIKHLENINEHVLQVYMEHIINVLGEDGPECHERLAELYLRAVLKPDSTENEQERLIRFLHKSKQYRPDRLLGKLPQDALPEIKAILLGRLGQHEKALKIYVYQLRDPFKAEAYCLAHLEELNVFQTLLKLFLQPTQKGAKPELEAALGLLARHGQHLDPALVMNILPPLLSVSDVRRYLTNASQRQAAERVRGQFKRETHRARLDQVMRATVMTQEQRVKITDSTLCPGCHKRIGNSVIAVHQPYGEVTHYRCQPPSRLQSSSSATATSPTAVSAA